MAEREAIVKDTKLKYTGVFDLDRVYMKVLEWLRNEDYLDIRMPAEKSYLERVLASGKQIEIILEGKKRDAGYFMMEITVKIFGKRVQDTETVVDGNKVKLQRGDLDLQFASALVWNVNAAGKDVFAETSLTKRVYERLIIHEKIEDMKIVLYQDTMKFVEDMKVFLNLYKLEA